ncbi:MAG: Rqc2 family fibronectin-binding protein [Fusobacteriaceae bacterium]
MFYIDGISLNKIKDEFSANLVGKKIGKITQETNLSVTLGFGKISLVISCSNTLPILYLSEDKNEKMNDGQFSFVLSLRKYFANASLEKIEQLGFDRILVFYFKRLNELGVTNIYKLYFEMMGKHSNIVITDEQDKILDLIKKFGIEDNRLRVLLPNVQYVQPIIESKKNPLEITEKTFAENSDENFVKTIEGVGKYLAEYIKDYKTFASVMSSKISPSCFFKGDKIILATVLENIEPKDFDEKKTFENFSDMVKFYLEKNIASSTVEILLQKIFGTINARVKKLDKILLNIKKDDEEKQNFNSYKEIGDILAANIFSLKKFDEKVELFDFYNEKNIEINLDKKISIQKNIDSYYKKYNKLKRGIESNKIRFAEIEAEINYLRSTLAFTETHPSAENLKNIIAELSAQNYFKNSKYENKDSQKKSKQKKDMKKSLYGIASENENYTIIYGRNNIENDFVTFKVGDKDDLWFHAKDIPGSHVILKCRKNLLKDDIIFEAGNFAAQFSKANAGDKVSVEYTERKNVSKPSGSKPGFVIYTNQKLLVITKK